MVVLASQDASGDLIIGANRQDPAADSDLVSGGYIGLPRIIRGEYAVRLMNRAAGIPVPPSPADVQQQGCLEEGVAQHTPTVAQSIALVREPGRNSIEIDGLHPPKTRARNAPGLGVSVDA